MSRTMRTTLALLASALPAAPAAPAAHAAQAQEARDVLQIRAATLLLSDGTRIEDGVLLVEDGKIRKVGRGVEVDPALPLVDHAGVLTAGIVVCQSESGTRGGVSDPTRSVLPAARAVDALDPDHPDLERALESGITTMVLSPGSRNVVGGRAGVVKSTGVVVTPSSHLALSFAGEALDGERRGPQAVEELSTRRPGTRTPTSYPGAVAELERLFDAGEGVFGAASRGEIPVLIEAWQRQEVARALGFARRHKLQGAIRGATLARDLVEPVRDSGLGVVLGPFDPAAPARIVESVRALAEAGVPVGVSVSPLIPGLNEQAIPRTLEAAREAGARWAWMTMLHLSPSVAPVFEQRLQEALPLRAERVLAAIRRARGGELVEQRFGERMRGHGQLWDTAHAMFKLWHARLGFESPAPWPDPSPFRRPTRQLSLL